MLQRSHAVRAENNFGRTLRNLWRNCRGVLWADLVFCWFGSIHFFPSVLMAKILGRKLVVVAGGYDVVNLPDINYGNMRGGIKTNLVRIILKLADKVTSISESNRQEAIENGRVSSGKNIMIYLGFDPFSQRPVVKEKMVVTVGEVSRGNLIRKGLGDFVRVASLLPSVPFKLIGKWSDDSHIRLEQIATSNVEILGFVDKETLSDVLSRAKVYVQASRHEAFGCSVAEAMLYKCIPVVNNVFSLPEVVGDCGLLTIPGDIEDLRAKIELALSADDDAGERAREQIVKNFPLEKRADSLLKAVADA